MYQVYIKSQTVKKEKEKDGLRGLCLQWQPGDNLSEFKTN